MTNSEFSDAFDVLLNSYNTQANFGEQASKREIALDEYEKSILLTQAQDFIVKSYFDRALNPQGQGIDDGTRRQVDFSSLITVEELNCIHSSRKVGWEDGNGYLGMLKVTNQTEDTIQVILNVHSDSIQGGIDASFSNNILTVDICWTDYEHDYQGTGDPTVINIVNDINDYYYYGAHQIKEIAKFTLSNYTSETVDTDNYTVLDVTLGPNTIRTYDDRGMIFKLPSTSYTIGDDTTDVSKVLFILNEKLIVNNKTYVIVPISYSEYDRRMSKAYSEPLKKQAWRLFQNINTGFDIYSELIPKWNVDINEAIYRIRYIRKPRPIILRDLEGLYIDGIDEETSCELNPILHRDILNKAFEMAVQTRGGGTAVQERS